MHNLGHFVWKPSSVVILLLLFTFTRIPGDILFIIHINAWIAHESSFLQPMSLLII